MEAKSVYLAGAVRTPIGKFGGTLASWTAADLGVAVAVETLKRAGVNPEQVNNDKLWSMKWRSGSRSSVSRHCA